MIHYVQEVKKAHSEGGKQMDNMRGFTVAIYPETRKELEVIKNKNNFTWDELFNYLMKIEKSKKTKARNIERINY